MRRNLGMRILIATIVALGLFIWFIAQSGTFSQTPTTTTTTVAATATTTTLPPAELVDGVSVVFQTRSNAFRNDNVRRTITQAIAALPEHLANEIRDITVYVVDSPIRCINNSLPPGSVVAACADGVDNAWVELILNNGGGRLRTVVHEFGHIIGGDLTPWGTQRYAAYFNQIYVAGSGDAPPTTYGERFFFEDYADSFSLYVLDQNRLRRCCPDRYDYFKSLFEPPRPVTLVPTNPTQSAN